MPIYRLDNPERELRETDAESVSMHYRNRTMYVVCDQELDAYADEPQVESIPGVDSPGHDTTITEDADHPNPR